MQNQLKDLKIIKDVFSKNKRFAITVFLLSIFASISQSFGLFLILPILQIIIEGEINNNILVMFNPVIKNVSSNYIILILFSLFIMLTFLKLFFNLIRSYYTKKLAWKLQLDWMNDIYAKYLKSSFIFIINRKQGELINNLLTETRMASICVMRTMDIISQSILLLVLFITLLLLSYKVTLFLSFFMCGLFVLSHNISKNFAQKLGNKVIKLNQQITSLGAEGIAGIRQIKTYSLEDWFITKFKETSHMLAGTTIRFEMVEASISPMGEMLFSILLVLSIIYILIFTDINLKNILPSIGLFVIIGQRLIGNFTNIAAQRLSLLRSLPSLVLITKLKDDDIEEEKLLLGEKIKYSDDIIFDDVTFGYEKEKIIINKLDFTIRKGKTTALIGASGSGKSTIADLILGLYQIRFGRIMINQRDLRELNLKSWRNKIGYISQEPFLFNMTIKENITIGINNFSHEEIVKAALEAYAHEFIMNLPKGYDSIVGDRGLKLSGGERQRIAIARAIIRNPDILIFDEATSALDNESEKLVQKAIVELGKEKTILIIAHRKSTIKNADYIFDLNKRKYLNFKDLDTKLNEMNVYPNVAAQ
ncbi:ABC transporter ATP-binding protein [Candidatus Parcubacteria bacterium]|nr:MAG: ABC transporter ATP-binding protein [Candidatus Parcubacteria bacterium]